MRRSGRDYACSGRTNSSEFVCQSIDNAVFIKIVSMGIYSCFNWTKNKQRVGLGFRVRVSVVC